MYIAVALVVAAHALEEEQPSGNFDCDKYVHTKCWKHNTGPIGPFKWPRDWPNWMWQEWESPGSCVYCGHGDEKEVQGAQHCLECPKDFPNLYPWNRDCSGLCANDRQLRDLELRNVAPPAYTPQGELICVPWTKCAGSGPAPRPRPRPRSDPTKRPTQPPRPTGRPAPRPTRNPRPQPTRRPQPKPTPNPRPKPTPRPIRPTPEPTKASDRPRPPSPQPTRAKDRPTKNPTPEPTKSTPNPTEEACPWEVEPLAKSDCPSDDEYPITTKTCADPTLRLGDLCEADGECGTKKRLDNCKAEVNSPTTEADLYRVVAVRGGTRRPTVMPVAKPTFPACQDDDAWFQKNNANKGCAWIATAKNEALDNRCVVKGDDGRWAFDACRATCSTCLAENACAAGGDSPTWVHASRAAFKNCEWVADFAGNRCAQKGVDGTYAFQSCRIACRTCGYDCGPDDDAWTKANDPTKTCDWVAVASGIRCDTLGLDGRFAYQACPAACRACGGALGECQDDDSFFKKNDVTKDCQWIGDASDEVKAQRCLVKGQDQDYAFRSCPVACDTC